MTGKIKIIGANNKTHLEWMEKEFENCSILHNGSSFHVVSVPERGEFPFDIYKSLIIADRMIFEGHANIEGSHGRLAIEFFPQ